MRWETGCSSNLVSSLPGVYRNYTMRIEKCHWWVVFLWNLARAFWATFHSWSSWRSFESRMALRPRHSCRTWNPKQDAILAKHMRTDFDGRLLRASKNICFLFHEIQDWAHKTAGGIYASHRSLLQWSATSWNAGEWFVDSESCGVVICLSCLEAGSRWIGESNQCCRSLRWKKGAPIRIYPMICLWDFSMFKDTPKKATKKDKSP